MTDIWTTLREEQALKELYENAKKARERRLDIAIIKFWLFPPISKQKLLPPPRPWIEYAQEQVEKRWLEELGRIVDEYFYGKDRPLP